MCWTKQARHQLCRRLKKNRAANEYQSGLGGMNWNERIEFVTQTSWRTERKIGRPFLTIVCNRFWWKGRRQLLLGCHNSSFILFFYYHGFWSVNRSQRMTLFRHRSEKKLEPSAKLFHKTLKTSDSANLEKKQESRASLDWKQKLFSTKWNSCSFQIEPQCLICRWCQHEPWKPKRARNKSQVETKNTGIRSNCSHSHRFARSHVTLLSSPLSCKDTFG